LKDLFPEISHQQLDQLLAWCTSVRRRLLKYYESAAKNYFQFLQKRYHKDGTWIPIAANASGQVSKYGSSIGSDAGIVVTLRLFRLLLHYGGEFEDIFASEFTSTPLPPWKDILPQVRVSSIQYFFSQH
jgi:hypothetical protein